jgi:hypothetical protein
VRNISAHKLVLKTAQDMAFELYEEVMSGSNEMYKGWKELVDNGKLTPKQAERMFVALVAPKLLEPARAILSHMLGDPQFAHLHEGIYDSILLDNTLRAGRIAPQGRAKLNADSEGNLTKVTTR